MTKVLFECKACGIGPIMLKAPVHHDCPFEKPQSEPIKQKPWTEQDCVHLGEQIGEIPCTCPSAGTEPVYKCHFHGTPCSRTGSTLANRTKAQMPDLRSCVKCWGLDEGYQQKSPQQSPGAFPAEKIDHSSGDTSSSSG